MALQTFQLNDDISLLFEVLNETQFLIKKIVFGDEEHLRILKIDGENLSSEKIYLFDNNYKFTVYDLLTKNSEEVDDFLGISNPFTKTDSLFVDSAKYYNLNVNTKDTITSKANNFVDTLMTTHFNNTPLFYKFYINDLHIDFDTDVFRLYDLDGFEITNYTVDTYGNDHIIHLEVENNNSYFYQVNDYKAQCELFLSQNSLQFSQSFDGNKITFEHPKYMEFIGISDYKNLTNDFYYVVELEDGSFKTLDVQNIITTSGAPYRTVNHLAIKDFVRSVSLFSKTLSVNDFYNSGIHLFWIMDSRIKLIDGDYYYTKFNSNSDNVIFTATPHIEITEEDLIPQLDTSVLNDLIPEKRYIFEANVLVEHEEGNIYVNSQSTDICFLSYNEIEEFTPVENILEFETTEQEKEYSDFYNRNFKSVSSFTKYGDQ